MDENYLLGYFRYFCYISLPKAEDAREKECEENWSSTILFAIPALNARFFCILSSS